ncbi:MAG: KUP/HAK/KT family potassium transporter, partial [Atopobiaceae bacterium]|nr:KUP/HAK/KT family potassium transporter [Atopobiaceae bacterium]
VSEAARLDLMPHLQVTYPSETKGQIYIPLVNWIMLAGCIFVVLLFRSSERMEAAYGLAITVTMLMTTTLLVAYIARVKKKPLLSVVFALVFGAIELSFFVACLTMFFDGGYVMIILSALLFVVMFVWKRGTAIERSQSVYLETINYVDQLARLRDDESVPLLADNLVFLTNNSSNTHLDRDILYSILDKRPKRAKAYWFLTVQVAGGPHTLEYSVNDFGTDFVFKVHIKLGFKVNQRVNSFLRQIVGDLVESGELAPQGRPYSIYHDPGNVGNFRFCMLHKVLSPESDISGIDLRIMSLKYFIRSLCGSPAQWFGLENSSVLTETVPLFTRTAEMPRLKRVSPGAGVTGKIRRITEDDQAHSGEADDIISGNIASVRAKVTSDLATSVIGGDTAVFTPIRTHDDEDSGLDEEALAEELAIEEGIIAAEVSAKAEDDLSDIGAGS